MTIKNGLTVRQYYAARTPFLWIQTTEDERVIRTHRQQLKAEVNLFSWDIAGGFQALTKRGAGYSWQSLEGEEITNNPATALEKVMTMPEGAVYYLKDFHRYFVDIQVIRRALNIKDALKATRRLVVFISSEPYNGAGKDGDIVPSELKNDITPFYSPLPSQDELAETIKRVSSDNNIEVKPAELDLLSNALIGLTEESAENALALCLVTQKRLDPQILLKAKARLIESAAGLTFNQYTEKLDELAGLENLINYVLKAAPSIYSSCILLYGIPGTGKSHLAKALGNALQWPVIGFSLNNIRTKYQGGTESNLERGLDTIEALGRSIVFVDEVDKALRGAEGGADADAGTSARIIGRLLSYFQDKKEGGSYWIMTANSLQPLFDISGGAMIRRFDAMFFLDFPTEAERRQIIKIWNAKNNVSIPDNYPCEGFTGADIAKLSRTMKMLGCNAEEARRFVIPTSQALAGKIEEIRRAAKNTCIPAGKISGPASEPKKRTLDL